MGGSTALLIAGARIDPERLSHYCDTDEGNSSLCSWVRQSDVDLHAMDMSPAGHDYLDTRIRSVVAIDPALVDVLIADAFPAISIPVLLMNLGHEDAFPSTVAASKITAMIPGATYELVEDASHYSMFAECRPGATGMAVAAGIEEPICTDGDSRDRQHAHAQLIDRVSMAFEQTLTGPR